MTRKLITGITLAVLAAGLITAGIIRSVKGGNAILVQAARIERGNISSYITADGTVTEVDKAEVFFDTPLKVRKVHVTIGDRVKKGQQILEVDLDELNSQLRRLKINRETQQASADSKVLDAEVERALNNLKAAERYYNDSKNAYENSKALYDENRISKAELDISEKAFKEAESGVSGLENARLAYNIALENRKNAKKAAEDNLKVLDIQINDLEKKINSIISDCSSPMDGVVASISVQEGAFINSMQAAYKVINPDRLQVKARVKEYDIKSISVGQQVKITGEAIADGMEINGTVKSISPVAVTNITSTGNETIVEVFIEVDENGDILKPGLNVSCEIAASYRENIILAPMEALTLDKDDNNMVFVIDENSKTMLQRRVKTGIYSDMYVEILEGVKEGDLVVLDPQPYYKDGTRVKIKD